MIHDVAFPFLSGEAAFSDSHANQILPPKSVFRDSEVIVIDLNLDAVPELRNAGHSAVYGDVRQAGVLIEAGIQASETFILSANIEDAADII